MASYSLADASAPFGATLSTTTVDTITLPKLANQHGHKVTVTNVTGSDPIKVTWGVVGSADSPATATNAVSIAATKSADIPVLSTAIDVKVVGNGNTYTVWRNDSKAFATAAAPAVHRQWLDLGDWAAGTYNLADYVKYGSIKATLTGNITLGKGTGMKVGDRVSVVLYQDGTGSRTVTAGSNVNLRSWTLVSTASTLGVTATFVFDGTDWIRWVA